MHDGVFSFELRHIGVDILSKSVELLAVAIV